MFRLIGFLVTFALAAGGFMFVDYKMSARWAGREDAEGLTFQEYLSGLAGRIGGLAQNATTDGDRGVRAKHRSRWQAAAGQSGHCGVQLECSHALHIGGGRFTRPDSLQRFGILIVPGQQQFVRNAHLFEQLAASGALRGQIDEGLIHGGRDGGR